MFDAAFVVLRELSELLLIAVAVLGCLRRAGRGELVSTAVVAMVAGCAMGWVAMGLLAGIGSGPRMEALVTSVLGAATLWVAVAMLFSHQAIENHVDDALADLLVSRAGPAALAFYCALAGFRESLEVGVFLRAAIARQGTTEVAMGAALGVAMAGIASIAFRHLWPKLRLLTVYRASTLVLCFISVKLLLGGSLALAVDLWPAQGASVRGFQVPAEGMGISLAALLVTLWPCALLVRRWWREAGAS